MYIQNNNHKISFNANFVQNRDYLELVKYARKQKNYPEFKQVIEKLKKLPDIDLFISYFKNEEVSPKCTLSQIKSGQVTYIPVSEVTITDMTNRFDGDVSKMHRQTHKNISAKKFAYETIIKSSNAIINFIKNRHNKALSNCKKVYDSKFIEEVLAKWKKEDYDIYSKYKADPIPSLSKDKLRLCDKMSILDFLEAMAESRNSLNPNIEHNMRMEDHEKYYFGPLSGVNADEVENFLYSISSDKELQIKMAKEFSENPRKAEEIKEKLIELLSIRDNHRPDGYRPNGYEKFYKWLHDENFGYKKAYSEYFEQEVWNKATSLIDIVKQSPNLTPYAFLDKARELNVEPTLGDLPKSFGNLDDFRLLINELTRLEKTTKKTHKKMNLKYFLNINDRNYEIEPLKAGLSSKSKYKITPEGDDTYIIKFNTTNTQGNTRRSREIITNQALKGDSPYLNALVDFYLKENGCKNVADIQFYDYSSKAVLYKATKGSVPKLDDKIFNNLYLFNKSKIAKELNELGIVINDVNTGNFIEDSNGKLIFIDTGHAEYSHPFRPMLMHRHMALSNICGREIKSTPGA